MSGASQLRFMVIVFCLMGGANLVMAVIQLALGLTPRLAPVLGGAAYVLAAWQLWRGSAIAQFALAAMSIITGALGMLMGFIARGEFPVSSLLIFMVAALSLICAYLLLFSRTLRAELKSRRVLNREANRIAFERSLSES
jgi:hypothetical protein